MHAKVVITTRPKVVSSYLMTKARLKGKNTRDWTLIASPIASRIQTANVRDSDIQTLSILKKPHLSNDAHIVSDSIRAFKPPLRLIACAQQIHVLKLRQSDRLHPATTSSQDGETHPS